MNPTAPIAPTRPRWQIGLRGLGLMFLAIALWLTVVANRREIARLEGRIATLRPIARELVVDDPARFAVVLRAPRWQGEDRWDVHLPPGDYRLCLATREVADGRPGAGEPGPLAPVVRSLPIGPGRHRVELDIARADGPYKLALGLDGGPRAEVEEPKEWGSDGSSGGGEFPESRQVDADRPLVLFRRRFMRTIAGGGMSSPTGPTEGVLLWIERAGTRP